MHLDEAEHSGAVFVRHPVGRFDLAARHDVLFEMRVPLVVRQVVVPRSLAALAHREHRVERERVGHREPSSMRSTRSTRWSAIRSAVRRPSGSYQAATPLMALRIELVAIAGSVIAKVPRLIP